LEVRLDAVLAQPWIVAERMVGVGQDLVEGDRQRLALGAGDHPMVAVVGEGVGRVHPVQRLVGTAVGVDGDASVGLHHDQPHGLWQVGRQAAGIVDRAAGDHETHVVEAIEPTLDGVRHRKRVSDTRVADT
jgi:hypothetical protein